MPIYDELFLALSSRHPECWSCLSLEQTPKLNYNHNTIDLMLTKLLHEQNKMKDLTDSKI